MNEITNNLSSLLVSMYDTIGGALPGIITGLVILILGWFIAKILSGIIAGILKRVGVDKLGAKLREVELFKNFNYTISDIFKNIIYYFVLFTAFIAAFDAMGLESVSNGIKKMLGYIPGLIVAVIIFLAGSFIADMLRKIVKNATASLNISGGTFISNFVYYFLLVIVSMMALNQAGVDTTIISNSLQYVIIAILAMFAIGYGFASRDLMGSTLASFYTKDKVQVGQKVSVDGITGKVVAKDTTSLTLDTGDKKVMVPLKKLLEEKVEIH